MLVLGIVLGIGLLTDAGKSRSQQQEMPPAMMALRAAEDLRLIRGS